MIKYCFKGVLYALTLIFVINGYLYINQHLKQLKNESIGNINDVLYFKNLKYHNQMKRYVVYEKTKRKLGYKKDIKRI